MLTWKLKATTFNRFYFQLRVSALPTSGTGFGLLPTPTTDSANDQNAKYAQGGMPLAYAVKLMPTPAAQDGKNHTLPTSQRSRDSVPGMVMRVMLPTPQASDSKRGAAEAYVNEVGKVVRRSVTSNGRAFGAQLTDVVRFLPTPLANVRDAKSSVVKIYGRKATDPQVGLADVLIRLLPTPAATSQDQSATYLGGNLTLRGALLGTPRASRAMASPLTAVTAASNKGRLEEQVAAAEGPSGSLNPRFVAQMMGFPPDWCELP